MGAEHIISQQNNLIRKFKKADAADPAAARRLDEFRVRDNRIFRGLVRRGVFVEAGEGRYYIDLDQAAEFKSLRRRIAFYVGLAIVLLALILFLTGNFK